MVSLGLDYAGGRPSAQAIKDAGYQFVVRYLTAGGRGLPGKLLLPEEYRALVSVGVAVAVNFETTADRMKYGAIAGAQDAALAKASVRVIGFPQDRPVYFSADWDAQPFEYKKIDDYLAACAALLGIDNVGVYGSYAVVKHCLDVGSARWAWQTGAWSKGKRDPRIHIYQRIGTTIVGGVPCDVNEACVEDFGQHPCLTRRSVSARLMKSVVGDEDDMDQMIVKGKGRMVLHAPTGSASAHNRRIWLAAAVPELTGDGWIRVFAQGAKGGINDWLWNRDALAQTAENLVRRPVVELQDGTTHLVVLWDLSNAPDGGTLCLETKV